jgi:5-methylcytosine-specific restriction endonuclease McrA
LLLGKAFGGTSKRPQKAPRSDRYISQEVVQAVFKRDHYRCVKCGALKDTTKLVLHHVVPYRHSGSNTKDNLITLCEHCHKKEHSNMW